MRIVFLFKRGALSKPIVEFKSLGIIFGGLIFLIVFEKTKEFYSGQFTFNGLFCELYIERFSNFEELFIFENCFLGDFLNELPLMPLVFGLVS